MRKKPYNSVSGINDKSGTRKRRSEKKNNVEVLGGKVGAQNTFPETWK